MKLLSKSPSFWNRGDVEGTILALALTPPKERGGGETETETGRQEEGTSDDRFACTSVRLPFTATFV
jgi:hypothetical protein